MRQRHLYTLCHVFLASFFLFAPTVLASPDVKAFARSHVPRPLDPGKVRRADLSLSLSPTSTSLNPASITSEWRPEASALESANRNNTALQLGQYILTHANDECKATGGGCSMFNYTLTDCLTDSCACEDETTLAAMVCASCQPEENVVKVYNKYLEICKQEGMAQPSDTVVVTVPWLSAQPSPSPGGSVPSGGATISGNVILTVNDLPGVGSTGSDSVPGPSGASGPSQPSPSPSGAAVNVIQTSIIESPSAPTLSPSASVPIQSGQPAGLLMGLYDPNANVQPSFSSALSPGGVSGLPNANLLGLDVLPTASGGSSTAPSSSALRPATSGPASVVMPDPDAIANARVQALGEAAASRSESVSLPFATSSGALSASARPPASLGSATLVSAAEVTLPAGGNTTALEKSTLALNAAIAFFSVKIDPKCDKDCGTWRSLLNTCTQDLCICTDPGVLSASACQQCLGTTTHGTGYQSQMADYSAFAGNCSAEVEGLSPSASKSAAYDIVAAATSRAGTGSPSGVPRSSAIGVTVPAAAANEVVVTKTSAASPVTSLRLHYEVWVTALTGLAVGASVLYAVV